MKGLLVYEQFEKSLKWLSSMLPIKRIYDFCILRYLIDYENISFEQAKDEIMKWVNDVDDDSVYHSMEFLNQDYFDSGQKSRIPALCEYRRGKLYRTSVLNELLRNPRHKEMIEDVLEYGLFRYDREFGESYFGLPHFKLYEQYQMMDSALLSNYRKSHSAFRGSGLLANGNDYFLFVDLHKEADIDERLNYNDKIIDRNSFQWESQNNTTQHSERGKNIIFNQERGINLHLFVRKYREIEKSNIEPFIYLGKVNTRSFKGERPIEVQFDLEHTIPQQLYIELTEKV
ncbi:DUF3427 domain-containing protein [Pseudalkalibacillus berkeleyi]|uniref:DUF3427 domain-containing protein n=1 Tax=Pseudalkalibacillus berkeleyi TaxID=1069813 RepID=A0ABS9H2T6_9BACL|nr:DUF3427 domain-containing protein [Pseudalkalibacillus berkeleyi]MCF6139194.1 DUF3427 domain-containing protein [Pseudalkalibacillus berkeleyi]